MTKREMKIVEEAIETSRQAIKAYLDLNFRFTDKGREGLDYILDYQARCAVDEIKRRAFPAEVKNSTADMQTWVEWNDHFPM